jgi:hypothetical protein
MAFSGQAIDLYLHLWLECLDRQFIEEDERRCRVILRQSDPGRDELPEGGVNRWSGSSRLLALPYWYVSQQVRYWHPQHRRKLFERL